MPFRHRLGFGLGVGGGKPPATVASLSPLVWYTPGPAYCFTDTGLTTPAADGGAVRGWADRSGNGHHAYGDGTSTLNLVGGKWFVTVGSGGMMFDAALTAGNPFTGAAAAELVQVLKNTAAGTQEAPGVFGSAASAAWWPFGTDAYANFGSDVRHGPYPLGGIDTTAIHVHGVSAAAGSYALRVDGTVIGSEVANAVGWIAAANLLRTLAGSTPARRVGEIVGFGRVLSTGDRATLMGILRAGWGTP